MVWYAVIQSIDPHDCRHLGSGTVQIHGVHFLFSLEKEAESVFLLELDVHNRSGAVGDKIKEKE